mmetsp:Transcript_112148/g.317665  ORF Transcript_112148/g.317665 Transcript_112148/m.317665 type:complete len:277 (+) Transcript_112148:27-857(+)
MGALVSEWTTRGAAGDGLRATIPTYLGELALHELRVLLGLALAVVALEPGCCHDLLDALVMSHLLLDSTLHGKVCQHTKCVCPRNQVPRLRARRELEDGATDMVFRPHGHPVWRACGDVVQHEEADVTSLAIFGLGKPRGCDYGSPRAVRVAPHELHERLLVGQVAQGPEGVAAVLAVLHPGAPRGLDQGAAHRVVLPHGLLVGHVAREQVQDRQRGQADLIVRSAHRVCSLRQCQACTKIVLPHRPRVLPLGGEVPQRGERGLPDLPVPGVSELR